MCQLQLQPYLRDVDTGDALDEFWYTLHDAENFSRELGSTDFSAAAGHHRHLAGLRQRRCDLSSDLKMDKFTNQLILFRPISFLMVEQEAV